MLMSDRHVEWARTLGLSEEVIQEIDHLAWKEGHLYGQSVVDSHAISMINVSTSVQGLYGQKKNSTK